MNNPSIQSCVADVPDFPKAGVMYRDITPLLATPEVFAEAVNVMADYAKSFSAEALVAIESRGFIFAAPMALRLNLPLHLVRKPGKLPRATSHIEYELEYGTDRLEMHTDAVKDNERIVLVDDILATGGTAAGTAKLVTQLGANVVGVITLLELAYLNGRSAIADLPYASVLSYD